MVGLGVDGETCNLVPIKMKSVRNSLFPSFMALLIMLILHIFALRLDTNPYLWLIVDVFHFKKRSDSCQHACVCPRHQLVEYLGFQGQQRPNFHAFMGKMSLVSSYTSKRRILYGFLAANGPVFAHLSSWCLQLAERTSRGFFCCCQSLYLQIVRQPAPEFEIQNQSKKTADACHFLATSVGIPWSSKFRWVANDFVLIGKYNRSWNLFFRER